jgi:hypothetical protein
MGDLVDEAEWFVSAKIRVDQLQHRKVRSMALIFMPDRRMLAVPFELAIETSICGKTVSTDLDLTGIGNVRMSHSRGNVLDSGFPQEVASY